MLQDVCARVRSEQNVFAFADGILDLQVVQVHRVSIATYLGTLDLGRSAA